MKLGTKILSSQVGLVVLPVALVAAIAVWQADRGFQTVTARAADGFEGNRDVAKKALDETVWGALANQTQSLYGTCATQQEVVNHFLTTYLSIARETLSQGGSMTLGDSPITWKAVNQFTKAETEVKLPELRVGDLALRPNADGAQASPFVDQVTQLVGATCTIFQRMNPAGDMLRVCTSVKKADGTRAIATYIPTVEPDGAPNPVLAAILRGESYSGRAFVVDSWCFAAYEPLRDAAGQTIGMLYVGIPDKCAAALREVFMAQKVGKTGYAYVLNAKGEHRGKYVISQGGKRDGERIWDMKDADGKLVIQEICTKALTLKPGEIADIRYSWKNAGDAQAREKVVKLAYFAPWDWVIGAGAYVDELQEAATQMDGKAEQALAAVGAARTDSRKLTLTWCAGIGGLAAVLAVVIALLTTRNITKPVNRIVVQLSEGAQQVNEAATQVSASSQELAAGNNEQASSLEETSSALEQMAAMTRTNAENANKANALASQARQNADASDQTMTQLNTAMAAINNSAGKIGKIIKVIEEIAFQTNLLALNAAVEAARAGEQGKGFAVVAEEVRNLAQRSAGAARDTTDLIEDSVARAKEGTAVAGTAGKAIQRIATDIKQVSELLNGITTGSNEQAQGVEQINLAVSQMDKITQQNAAGAEESASASEELTAQSSTLTALVGDLVSIVGSTGNHAGSNGKSNAGPPRGAPPARAAKPQKATRFSPATRVAQKPARVADDANPGEF